jgi:two-component system response regulator NreC
MTARLVDILIIDDHPVMREELKALLWSEKGYRVLDTKYDSKSALRAAVDVRPDILIISLTIRPGDGIESISLIKREMPGIKIVALTLHDDTHYIRATLKAGADAYVLKSDSRSDLLTALHHVSNGLHYLSPGIPSKAAACQLDKVRETPPAGKAG